METYTVYHYSSEKFDNFNADMCDGIWFTDIEPSDEELLNEIGANGAAFVATCEITINEETCNIDNYDVESQLAEAECDGSVQIYDGFNDYVVLSDDQVKIISWSKL